MKKKLFNLLGLMAMLLIISCTDSLIDDPVRDGKEIQPSIVEAEKQALMLGKNLINSFPKVVTRSGEQITYPDYYGGAFINKDKRFVVLVKGDTAIYKDDLIRRTQSNDVLVIPCVYSYEELKNILDQLRVIFLDESKRSIIDATTMRAFRLNTTENRIEIELEDFTADKIDLFKQTIFDSPSFVFKKSNGVPVLEASLKPGGPVWSTTSTSSGKASIGYRAKQNGIEGIVVSSHFLPSFGNPLYHSGLQIGNCLSSVMSGTIDAAFCEVYSGSTIGKITHYGNVTLGTSLGTIWSGSSVYMEGASSEKVCSGSIQDTDDNSEFEFVLGPNGKTQRVYLTNIVRTNYPSKKGDSGGVVYDSYNNPLGIHAGASVIGEKFFIKGSEINRLLGLTMY